MCLCGWAGSLRGTEGGQLSDFIGCLGPGQLVGRQVLGSSAWGEIQLMLSVTTGTLHVAVVRAKGLRSPHPSKALPGITPFSYYTLTPIRMTGSYGGLNHGVDFGSLKSESHCYLPSLPTLEMFYL